jgi:hypothetical protein
MWWFEGRKPGDGALPLSPSALTPCALEFLGLVFREFSKRQVIMKGFGRFLPVSVVLLLLVSGCGYHFSGEGPGPRPGLKSVAIPVFKNKTSEPDLGSLFAGALRREFLRKGDLRVVPVDEADAIFEGTITSVHTAAVAHIEALQTIQSKLYVTLDIRCKDAKDGKVLWQDSQFTYYQSFLQGPDPIVSFDNRRQAEDFLAKEMSVRIHDRFLSNF